jgi:replicative DNA helicase
MARSKKNKEILLTEEFLEKGTRVPPQAVEVEKSVLGAMLLDKEAVGIAIESIDETIFYRDVHRKIYLAMVSLFEKNEPIDVITLSDELKKRNDLDDIGGSYYLTELAAMVPSSANIEYHLGIIKDKAILRQLIVTCSSVIKSAYDEGDDAERILDIAESEVFNISQATRQKSYIGIKELVTHTIEEIQRLHELPSGGIIGVPSGIHDLDDLLAGFQKSDLIIIAGRPSMGKTAFALNLARNAAVDHHVPVGYFSLEMSDLQLSQRIICSETGIDSKRLRTGKLKESEWPKLSRNVGRLVESPLYIDDTPGIDIMRLRARARRMAAEKKVGMIIIDYLQLMEAPRGIESRQQEITYISRSLKTLAKELNIPVIALSQLSRAVESREWKRPNLADLRESGAIEQDADVVMFVYRPEVYNIPNFADDEKTPSENMVEIIIGKHRNGPTGSTKLVFLKQTGKFLDSARHEIESLQQDAGF